MAGEEKQLVHRHREVYRSHEGAVVSGARVVTCTLQTAMRRSVVTMSHCVTFGSSTDHS